MCLTFRFIDRREHYVYFEPLFSETVLRSKRLHFYDDSVFCSSFSSSWYKTSSLRYLACVASVCLTTVHCSKERYVFLFNIVTAILCRLVLLHQ